MLTYAVAFLGLSLMPGFESRPNGHSCSKSVRFTEIEEDFVPCLSWPREHYYIYCPIVRRGEHTCDEGGLCEQKVKFLWKEYEFWVLWVEGGFAQKRWVMEDRRGCRIEEKVVWVDRKRLGLSMTLDGLPIMKYGDLNVEAEYIFTSDLKCIGRGI